MTALYSRTLGQGQSVVLVHGWAMHSRVWDGLVELLAQQYCVTCIDLPGHGGSEACDELTLADMSERLVAAVDADSSCWVGWSLGATVVLDVAQRFPERVNALVLLAGNPRFVQESSERENTWSGMAVEVFDAFSVGLQHDLLATIARFLSLQTVGVAGGRSQLSKLKDTLSVYPFPCLNVLQSGLAILKQSDLRPVLEKLTVPTAVVLGEKDVLVPVAVASYLMKVNPKLQIYQLKEAGHAVFLSHPQDVASIISHVLEG